MLPHCGEASHGWNQRSESCAPAARGPVDGSVGCPRRRHQDATGGAGQVLAVYVARNVDRDAIPAQLETTVAGRSVMVPVRQFEVGVVKAQAASGGAELMQMQMQDFK